MTRPTESRPSAATGLRGLFVAGLAGVTLALAFSAAGLWPLAWLAPGILLYTLNGVSPRRGAFMGWLFGLFFFLVTVWWVDESMTVFGGLAPMLGEVITLLLAATLALYTALFAGLFAQVATRLGYRVALGTAPFLWVAVEFLRERFPDIGFPWGRLGDSQYQIVPIIQIVDLAGVELLSFVMLAFCALGALAVTSFVAGRRLQGGLALTGGGIIVAALLTYGAYRLMTFDLSGASLTVAALQGNIDQHRKWDRDYAPVQLERYETLTRNVVAKGADLAIWPETAAPWYVGHHPLFDAQVRQLSAETGVPLIFGAPAEALDAKGERVTFNRAWSVDPDGGMSYYDKVKLAPFGEFVPFGRFLFFVRKLTTFIGDIRPGERLAPLPAGRHTVGVQICFEAIFPAYSRQLTADGAELLAVITNDSWFGRSPSSEQGLAMAVMRGVENRIPVVRAAQSGVSAIIRADGSILDRKELFETGYAMGGVKLRGKGDPLTLATRTGDTFRWMTVAFSLLVLLAARRRGR